MASTNLYASIAIIIKGDPVNKEKKAKGYDINDRPCDDISLHIKGF
jgi:hypothetical protein